MSLAQPVRLAEGQVAASGAVLARAFANDPFYTHTLSDPVERERLMPPYLAAWTRYGLLFGEVYVTAGPVEASAIWLPPSGVSRTEERMDQAGLTAVVGAFSDGARARYDAMGQHQRRVARLRPSVRTGVSLYRCGSHAAGPGLGSLLLRAGPRIDQDSRVPTVHERAERAALPAVRLRDRCRGGRPDGAAPQFMRRNPTVAIVATMTISGRRLAGGCRFGGPDGRRDHESTRAERSRDDEHKRPRLSCRLQWPTPSWLRGRLDTAGARW
jgi:hypothetical protein